MISQSPPSNAKHWLIGAGQIGCYLATVFQQVPLSIGAVARGQWLERLRKGFDVSDFNQNGFHAQPIDCVSQLSDLNLKDSDWLWITTKCTVVEEICQELADKVNKTHIIVFCQNGVGASEMGIRRFQSLAQQPLCLRAMVPFNVVWEDDRLHRGSEGHMVIETPKQDGLKQVLNRINHPMLKIELNNDMPAVQWAKLQLNLGNAVNALADIPVKAMLESHGYRKVIAAAMDELLAVVKALNINMPKVANVHGRWLPLILRLPNGLFKRVANRMLMIDPTVKTSMWWDIHQQRQTEIAYLQGAVIDAAKHFHIDTPVNAWLLNEIQKIEQGADRSQYGSGEEMLQIIWHSVKS